MALFIEINKDNPQERLLKQVVECLKSGGVIIYPTDTVYGIGCDIMNKKAIERICQIKGILYEKSNFSCIFSDLKNLSEYTTGVDTNLYKIMKMCLPGPYTFILKANKKIPGYFQSKKKTVGIRIVNHKIPTTIVEMLGNPILTTSLRDQEDEILEYKTDPELIYERYKKLVDIVINGGYGNNIPSTILDCSNENGEITLIRQGLGETHFITFNDED